MMPSAATETDPLLQPFRLGSMTVRNRLVSTSHEPAYTEDGMPKDRYRAYHVEKARGGVGLTMIGGSATVAADSPSAFGNVDLSTDAVIPWLARLNEECQAYDTRVMIQVTHLGARTSNYTGDWLPTIAPSRYREPQHRAFAKAAEAFDIERIIGQYASAAQRAAAAGLDGIELEHYGHLLDAFLTPWLNQRTDDWNGGFDERLRFSTAVIDAIRREVPADFLLGVRMSVDQRRADGLQEDEAIRIIDHYADHGVDFISLVKGTSESDRKLAEIIPGMGTPSAPFLDVCRRVRSAVSIPIMHATRITDVATARYALTSGCVDLVGMTRPQLADPHLVEKVAEGREDDIRPCVGANVCLDAIYTSGAAHCIHNPATGRELELPHEITSAARTKRRVVIIGAGPAGLEAARVCALRGHTVSVLEANSSYGGQVALAARSPRRRDLIGIVDWRYQQALKHGAQFRFDTLADPESIRSHAPDVVIVATGGLPDAQAGLPRAAGRLTTDVWDVMSDDGSMGQRAIVFDDHGQNSALDAVERLAQRGVHVTYVSPERTIGIDVGGMNASAYLDVFGRFGVDVILNTHLVDITAQKTAAGRELTALLRHAYSDTDTELTVDSVVVDHGTVPCDDIYTELVPASLNGGAFDHQVFIHPLTTDGSSRLALIPEGAESADAFELYRIGDAVTSRNIHAAVLEGLRLGLLV